MSFNSTLIPIIVVPMMLASLPAASNNASALQIPQEVNIISFGAGEVDSTGWYPAKSNTNRFQIHFPTRYDEWSASLNTGAHITNSLSATSSEDIKFLVTEFVRGKDKQFKNLKTLSKSVLKKKRRTYTKRFMHNGIKTTEVKVPSSKSTVIYRFLMTTKHVYQLSIEYPKKQRKLATKVAPQFFNSFRIF